MALTIGRMCQTFHCLPSQALREWRLAPDGWLEEVMEALAYASAKQLYDAADKKTDLPRDAMIDSVVTTEMRIAHKDIYGEEG